MVHKLERKTLYIQLNNGQQRTSTYLRVSELAHSSPYCTAETSSTDRLPTKESTITADGLSSFYRYMAKERIAEDHSLSPSVGKTNY
jgi:hypothetical protein